MVSSEKFSLKWSDFQQKVSQSFKKLRNESGLYDVTLVSDDHQPVSAHKVVLSSCSDFFRKIFQHNTYSHPLIYLDNLKVEDLNLMLDYIYHGEVQIYHHHLDKFLNLASKYKLEGLLPDQNEDEEVVDPNIVDDDQLFSETKNETIEANTNTKFNESVVKIEEPQLVKSKRLTKINETIEANTAEVNLKFNELVVKIEKIFTCTFCNKKMVRRLDMWRHIETHITGLSYECDICGRKFRSSIALITHNTKICTKSLLF